MSQEMSWKKHLITMLMGSWLIIGIFLDGFAHNHGAVESFFTPWHAALYSGFLASAIWIFWLTYMNKSELQVSSWFRAFPRGYGLGVAGVFLFLVGGICDMIWHIIFGIEVGIDALLSPTHLLLFSGALLILSSPFRAAWTSKQNASQTFKEFFPTLLSIALVMSIIAFFLMYAWAFNLNLFMLEEQDAKERAFVDFLITTQLLVIPVFLLFKRWKLPWGAVTFLFGFETTLMAVLFGFNGRSSASILIVIVAGVVGDFLLRNAHNSQSGLLKLRLFAFFIPILIWSLFFVNERRYYAMDWPPELWGGTIFLCGLCSLGISVLVVPPHEAE
jgi:hypothetical protein